MKQQTRFFALTMMLIVFAFSMFAQAKRTDVIWARTTANPITLDGKLTEADWAKAESLQIRWGQENGLPGSGYNTDGQAIVPTDPVKATVKFLVNGDSLYVAVVCKDSSIGAGDWPGPFKWDGILSNMRKKSSADRPVPNGEIYMGWVSTEWADSNTKLPGHGPGYFGPYGGYNRWTDSADGLLKAQIWDSKTWVQGSTNDDSKIDTAWTTEFKINLKFYGYNAKAVAGDIIMYSIAIFDADWQWFPNIAQNRFSLSKAWAQGPWGGNNNNHLRVFVKPSVTTTSGAVPDVGPDLIIPTADDIAILPTIDGKLDEKIWSAPNIGKLLLRYGNDAIRNAYPNTAPFRSGQYQPDVNGSKAAIFDADTAIVKYFFKGNYLYLGFDVKDRYVQYSDQFDRQDGFRVMIASRKDRDGDSVLTAYNLTFIIDSTGGDGRREDLGKKAWDSLGTNVIVKTALNAGTTVDTIGTTPDKGYTAEMKIDLLKLGYPAGLGDGTLFFGLCRFDGDGDPNPANSYGYRVWFMREATWADGQAWMYMDPKTVMTSVGQDNAAAPKEFKLYGNYPNPFNPTTTIKFSLPVTNEMTLQVFDILGRVVATQHLGVLQAGEQEVSFDASKFATGVYTYRLRSSANQVLVGRMMLVK